MAHLPQIIIDLAMILLVAGFTTILFKKINQPVVLGYIIAGFITGPHFNFFPTISDTANIQTWSEIGVIFLLFALGLEFSFYKLKSVGSTAFIAVTIILGGMFGAGFLCGNLLDWNQVDSLFLGCMLTMSSTIIIIKAYDDLKVKNERFASIVLGILIIEDIAAIVMMVMISTLAAATADISTLDLIKSILRLVFFLVLWFVLGMYLVPTFFKRTRNLVNDETLIVASTGLCLGMVVLATNMGFSSALGAFIMGSLIAEAPNAEHIEHLIKPLKDLFGAVFFVSVGMLVNPALLIEYALPILCIILVTIIGQIIFSTSGVLASGQDLKTAMRCGFSLTQVGEFSFILASMGSSLGLTSDFLYPIIVAVSVTTTFTTPFCIMASGPAYNTVSRLLPEKVLNTLSRYTNNDNAEAKEDADWSKLLRSYFIRMLIFVTLLIAIALGANFYLLPYLADVLQLPLANFIAGGITLAVMAPILRALLQNRTGNAELFSVLWLKKRSNHLPLLILVFFKMLTSACSLYFIFNTIIGLQSLLSILAVLAFSYFISSSDWLLSEYLRIESRFLVNLNEKHMRRHRENSADSNNGCFNCFDQDFQLVSCKVPQTSSLIGKSLNQLAFRELYGCNILQVTTPQHTYDMPGGSHVLEENSQLLLIGTASQLKLLSTAIESQRIELEPINTPVSLREFMLQNSNTEQDHFLSCAISIDRHSPILGKSMKAANLRDRWNCLVIGLERGAYIITNPNVSLVFEKGDLLWVLGKQKMINTLVREEIL